MDASTLKAGSTKVNMTMSSKVALKSGPTMAGKKLAGGMTKLPGFQGKSTKQAGQSKMKSTTSERENEYVREGNIFVTPKRLITEKMKELAQDFLKHEQEQAEKQKKLKQTIKPQTSLLESSMKSQAQSVEKSSGSENKTSSANIKDSSVIDSSRRSEMYSESEEDTRLREERERKAKKAKTLSEDDKEKDIVINLQESSTEILLFIPSSLVSSMTVEPAQKQAREFSGVNSSSQIMERNQKYEQHCQDIVGSDKFSKRAAQTFKYAPKQQLQQSNRVEKAEKGVFAAVWDLYDAQLQEQYNEFEQLQIEIQKSIDSELKKSLKNPFCLLPVDVKSIFLHSRAEVPGDKLLLAEKINSKSKPGFTTSLGGNNTLAPSQEDAGLKDSSNSKLKDVSGTAMKKQFESQSFASKSYAGNRVHHEQLLKQHQETIAKLEQEEYEMIKQRLELAKSMPNDEEQKVITSEQLSTYLKYVDRILNQNTYHKQYILYRNYPEVKFHKRAEEDNNKRFNMRMKKMKPGLNDEDDEEKEKKREVLENLFKFSCDLTQDRTVSCADWNPINKDLLAVTYGELDLNLNKQGMIMFWTLKNPSYPERIIKSASRLTSCKFSEMNPNLLATGSYDGIVSIYDIRKKGNTPILCNDQTEGKHSDAIWELNWIGKGNKGNEKGESLVSISSDGRIVEWNMKKELENTELMSLKKSQNPSSKEQPNEGTNFRQAAGFSMDFIKGEYSTYLAATDDGPIHRCSKNYSGQYLESYFGHTGPVYRVRFNPFWSDIFLSCSADWSCRLWNLKEEQPLSTFQSLDLQDEVLDIEWSPNCSTLFASVAKDGRMELWDLTKNNMLDPFAQIVAKPNEPTFSPKTMVRFAQGAPVIITGDTAGDLNVYRLHGYEDSDPKVQHDRLVKLLYPSGYTKGVKDTTEVE